MPGSRWRRPLAAMMAFWLAFVIGEPVAVHACPMHDGVATAPVAGAHAAHHVGTGGQSDANPVGHHVCTCLGACSAAGPVATLPERPAQLEVVSVAGTVAPARARWLPAPAPAHLLPYANGPPRVLGVA